MADWFKLTVTVQPPPTTPASSRTLTFTPSGPGGSTNGSKSHRVFKNCDLFFECPDGDLLIHFKNPSGGTHRPFKSPHNSVNPIVFATKGTSTPALRTQNNDSIHTNQYTAAVAMYTGGAPFMIWEDPDLEDGGGGGLLTTKNAAKKTAKKTAKKKAKK